MEHGLNMVVVLGRMLRNLGLNQLITYAELQMLPILDQKLGQD